MQVSPPISVMCIVVLGLVAATVWTKPKIPAWSEVHSIEFDGNRSQLRLVRIHGMIGTVEGRFVVARSGTIQFKVVQFVNLDDPGTTLRSERNVDPRVAKEVFDAIEPLYANSIAKSDDAAIQTISDNRNGQSRDGVTIEACREWTSDLLAEVVRFETAKPEEARAMIVQLDCNDQSARQFRQRIGRSREAVAHTLNLNLYSPLL